MSNVKNEDVLNKIINERSIGNSSIKKYRNVINQYTKLTGHDLGYLIEEAINEENKHIPWRDKSLRKYLIAFQNHVYDTYLKGTARVYMGTIKSIYKTYEIELHPLPPFSKNRCKEAPPLLMKDLLTREEINKALDIASPVMESIILCLVSSGIDKSTALKMTIKDFVEGTKDYHSEDGSIHEILEELQEKDYVVPTFYLQRPKTTKYFFTFASPEFVKSCCKYLLNRKDELKLSSPLFKISDVFVTVLFERYNDQLKLGKAGIYVRLRGHMLRKYFATRMDKSEFLDKDMIDEMQGREKQVLVRRSYYFDDPVAMKKAYIKSLNYITIKDINIITVESEEYLELKKEYENTVKGIENMKDEYNKSIAREEARDEFRQLLDKNMNENEV